MRGLAGVCVVWFAFAAGAAGAQTPSAAMTGSVTGRVTFAETQLPARFAEVVLVRKPDAEDLLPCTPERLKKQQESKVQKVVAVSGRSAMDGSYTIAEVPPGDYFAIAKLPGYVVPIAMPADGKEATDIAKLTAQLATVHVDANRLATVDLALHRGGAIAGRVHFQDGSPVVGSLVSVEPATASRPWDFTVLYQPLEMALQSHVNFIDGASSRGLSGMTDDEGRFRIAGLPPGRYRVKTIVHTGGGYKTVSERGGFAGRPVNGHGDAVMTVYVPGAMRQADATVYEIRGDERIADADAELNLSGLHTVRGKVMVKEDRHVPNTVSIMLGVDGDKGMPLFGSVEEDGSFHIDYVPQGTYTLKVNGADIDETPPPGKESEEMWSPKMLHRYAPVKVPVIVAEHDVALEDILLEVSTAKEDEPDDVP